MIPETLFDYAAARDAPMSQVEKSAGEQFRESATAFVLDYLATNGPTAGETITDACKCANIIPPDDRAFGPVYMSLQRHGRIEKAGTVVRTKGHGTSGGNIWALKA